MNNGEKRSLSLSSWAVNIMLHPYSSHKINVRLFDQDVLCQELLAGFWIIWPVQEHIVLVWDLEPRIQLWHFLRPLRHFFTYSWLRSQRIPVRNYRRRIPRQALVNQPIKSPTHQLCQHSKDRIALGIGVFGVGDGIDWPFGFVEEIFELVA